MTMRHLCGWTLAAACVVGGASPARATDAAAAGAEPMATQAPTTRDAWLVTGHAVGDTASHVLDLAIRPAYWGAARGWWWLEGQVYRAQLPTVRVDMPQPEGLAPAESASSTE